MNCKTMNKEQKKKVFYLNYFPYLGSEILIRKPKKIDYFH